MPANSGIVNNAHQAKKNRFNPERIDEIVNAHTLATALETDGVFEFRRTSAAAAGARDCDQCSSLQNLASAHPC
jgi:hypothetical protein